jgi:hypothetical protein
MAAHQSLEPSEKKLPIKRVNEWSVGHRIVGPILVFCIMSVGAARWLESNVDAAAMPTVSEATPSVATEYLPAGYVNQGTSVEPHIQAF